MNESTGTPTPTANPEKSKTWVIVVGAVVVLCCLCIGAIGLVLAFGQPYLNKLFLYALLPILAALP